MLGLVSGGRMCVILLILIIWLRESYTGLRAYGSQISGLVEGNYLHPSWKKLAHSDIMNMTR